MRRPSASRRAARRHPGRSRSRRPTRRTARSASCAATAAWAHRRRARDVGQERVRVLRERRTEPRTRGRSGRASSGPASSPARMIADVVGFGTVWSPRANWRMIDFAGNARERLSAEMGRVRDRVARLRRPLRPLEQLLDRRRARDGVDERRQIPQRNVLVELEQSGQVRERRRPADEAEPDERPEGRAEPRDLDDRAARDVRDAQPDVRLDGEELRAVDAAERLAEVRDPRRDRDRAPRCRRRPSRPRSRGRAASGRSRSAAGRRGWRRASAAATALTPSVDVDAPFAVLVDPTAAGRKQRRARRSLRMTVRVPSGPKPWPTTLIAIVAMPRLAIEPATSERARVLVVGEAVPVDGDRPAARGSGSGREEEVEVEAVRPLHRGHAGAGADGGDHLRRRLVVGRVEGAERDRADAPARTRERVGRRERAGEGRGGARLPRELDTDVTLASGNTVRSPPRADHEVGRGRGRRLDLAAHLLEQRVALCVVKRLAAATSSLPTPAGSEWLSAAISSLR